MNEIVEQRLEKIKELKQMGIDPYGKKFIKESDIKDIVNNFAEEKIVITAGRIMAIRGHGKSMFMNIKDKTGKIQLYFQQSNFNETLAIVLKKLDIGDIIGIKGKLFKTKTEEITIVVDCFEILSKIINPLPEKWHGLKDIEIRYRQRYVDLIVNDDVKDRFVQRSQIIKAIRNYLDNKGFIEVETPMMQLIAGGAAAKPFITHHNTLDMDLYLRIAPELYLKRLLVGGLEKVYEINRNFRNEGISPRHNPEFTMLEIYSAYDDYKDMMNLTQGIIKNLIENIIKKDKIIIDNIEIDFSSKWKRITMKDVVKEYTDIDFDTCNIKEALEKFHINYKQDMLKEEAMNMIFEQEVEKKLINPTFVTDYPSILCPLSKTNKNNPAIAERFEFFINGQEVANAYSELNDPQEQKQRFLAQSKDRKEEDTYSIDEDFICALEYGMPPAGGLGIGIDRLVMMLTGVSNIRDVILFPQLRKITE